MKLACEGYLALLALQHEHKKPYVTLYGHIFTNMLPMYVPIRYQLN